MTELYYTPDQIPIVSVSTPRQIQKTINALGSKVVDLFQNQNGHRVIQKGLNNIEAEGGTHQREQLQSPQPR